MKYLAIILCIIMLLSFTGCADEQTNAADIDTVS